MPLTKLLSSDARKTTALAISSGVPTLKSGIALTWLSTNPTPKHSVLGVGITPGLTAFTRILRSLRSSIQLRAKERTAALVKPPMPKPDKNENYWQLRSKKRSLPIADVSSARQLPGRKENGLLEVRLNH
ncbi:hypothetical protein NUACC26_002530 [Scytonema sp. NUACC26]